MTRTGPKSRRVVSGDSDSGSAGGRRLNELLRVFHASRSFVDLYVLMMFGCIDFELCVYRSLISNFLMPFRIRVAQTVSRGCGPIGWSGLMEDLLKLLSAIIPTNLAHRPAVGLLEIETSP